MQSKKFCLILFTLLLINTSFTQQRQAFNQNGGGSISGLVYDSTSNAPIEYANIVLYSSSDSSQVTGTITNTEGKFTLSGIRTGNYYLDVQFIGYKKKRFNNISLSTQKLNIDLGKIFISYSSINLQDVVVEGERSPISYQIDKKVIDVNQMQTVVSGNAADVLENVPSVTVDIEGNVSLRGSTNFTVLIDGRPSVMSAQDILQQIPASSIDKIEIITNPSAKYNPEGTAGIINVIMKKNKNRGLSGIINANAGLNDKYGGDFLFENKLGSYSYNFGLDYNKRIFSGTSREENRFLLSNNTSFVNSNGDIQRGRTSFGLRGGIELLLSEQNILSFGGRYGYRDGERNSNLFYNEWSTNNPLNNLYFSNSDRGRSGSYFALNTNYQHKFETKGHELSSELFFSHNNGDELILTSEIENGIQIDGKKTTETGPSTEFRGKLDYSLPFSENSKFEAGYEGQIEKSSDDNKLYEFNTTTGEYDFQQLFSHNVNYDEREHAFYTIYSNEWNDLGFQGGIRTEYTYQNVKLEDTGEKYSVNRWDYFPTLHSSYKFEGGTQLMASYTRRIDRPHGWHLEPFLTWIDAYNVRRGNPALIPEFIDSYEFGFQTLFGKTSFSSEFYYRITHNKIEDVRSVYSENVTLTTIDNIGKDYSLGSELMLIIDPLEFWNINFMGNLYNYKIKGILYNEPFSRESFNWNTRINNVFKINKSTQLQANVRYNSPSVSPQGRWEGFFTVDAALKQDLFNKKLSLTLQARNLLGTAKREFSSSGPDFYNYRYFDIEAPMIMLNIKFNFNNYKNEDRRGEEDSGGMGNDDF